MIASWKARLRAWLIDLVREAIRSEQVQPGNTFSLKSEYPKGASSAENAKQAASAPIVLEPSFEQLQADSIREQENYYEPKH